MKTEDWTPALVEQRADAWLDQLPEDPAFQYQRNQGANRKGDPKQAKLEDARWKMQNLKPPQPFILCTNRPKARSAATITTT